MGKTATEWFETLPDGDLKTKLLSNLDYFPDNYESLPETIRYSFAWSDFEGIAFWQGVVDHFENKYPINESDHVEDIDDYYRGFNLAKETMEGQDGSTL